MTVIYSNFRDIDTKYAHLIWENIPDVTIIEITPEMIDSYEEIVNKAISEEDDTLVLFGHGTAHGLLFPDLNRGIYLVHDENSKLIHAKNVIGLWCYASSFGIRHIELKGFYTSMYISNKQEAAENSIFNISQEIITRSQMMFLSRINELLVNKILPSQWIMNLGAKMDMENSIEVFNYQGFYYNGNG